MRFLNKHFFFGLGAGIALTLLAAQLFILYSLNWAERGNRRLALYHFVQSENYKKLLSPPPIPVPILSPEEIHKLENWSVRSLDGRPVRLSDLKGKVVFINFWGTSCGPCVAEMPGIQKLADSLRSESIIFLLVTDEDEGRVREFLKTAPADLPVYLRGQDQDVPKALSPKGLPTTFILDRNGIIVFEHVGAANGDNERVHTFLRDLL